jgi:predicted NAD/FAD-dependent oxidoreductase
MLTQAYLIVLSDFPVIFDTGVHAPGGRCSTRVLQDSASSQRIIFDHSAQMLEAPEPGTGPWSDWVGQMVQDGKLRQWDSVGTTNKGKVTPKAGRKALVGREGMRSLVDALATGLRIDRPKWVRKELDLHSSLL